MLVNPATVVMNYYVSIFWWVDIYIIYIHIHIYICVCNWGMIMVIAQCAHMELSKGVYCQ